MLLQITQTTIDDRARGAGSFGAGAHQAAIDGINDPSRRRDEDHSADGDRIDLNCVSTYHSLQVSLHRLPLAVLNLTRPNMRHVMEGESRHT